jgi:hypothetical protein
MGTGTPGAQWVPSLHPDDPNLPIVAAERLVAAVR